MLLAACGGAGTAGGTVCPLSAPAAIPFLPQEYLVYPAPGSTGIPDNVQTIVVSRSTSKLTLIPAGATPVVTTTQAAVPSPLPSPNAPQHGAAAAFSVPALAASTTYQVWAQDGLFATPCGGPGVPFAIGSFTMQ